MAKAEGVIAPLQNESFLSGIYARAGRAFRSFRASLTPPCLSKSLPNAFEAGQAMLKFSRLFSAPLLAAAALALAGCSPTTEITTARTETTFLSAPASAEIDFERIFDGRTFAGWKLLGKKGAGFGIKDGILYCAAGGGGKLLTEKQYANFILRFDFRLSEGANNGVAIRAPFTDRSLAYDGMEIQILDDSAEAHRGRHRPAQYHGALYDVLPPERPAPLNPPGRWNSQEIYVKDRRVRVTVNGKLVLDADLNSITDPKVIQKHPGLFRERGHIGFMGHNDFCEFRDIRIKELPKARVYNRADRGFDLLFNGHDLSGWYGGLDPSRQAEAASEKAREINRRIADLNMRAHWSVQDGALVHDGQGSDIFSEREYGDMELALEYRVTPGATGGVLPLGLPGVVVQDRDTPGNELRLGSGGLHDGNSFYQAPSKYADRFAGAWNRMRIILAGGRIHVFVNDELVVKNAAFKNPNLPGTPLPERGPVGLASGRSQVAYRSLYARGLKQPAIVKPRPPLKPLPAKEEKTETDSPATRSNEPGAPVTTGVSNPGGAVTEPVGPAVVAPSARPEKKPGEVGRMKLIEKR